MGPRVPAFVVGLCLLATPSPASVASPPADPLIGAIRWDAWAPQYSYSAPSIYTDYGYREPLQGWHNGGVPDHAAIVDREIDDAADRGLDYWSFVWYPETTGEPVGAIMSAFNDYMASPKHHRLKFTFMLQSGWVASGSPDDPASHEGHWRDDFVPYFVDKFKDPQYVKVNGNRPLLYWFDTKLLGSPTTTPATCAHGFCDRWQQQLRYLEDRTVAAGLGKPFIVDNTYDVASATIYGFQGVTSYGPAGAAPGGPGHHCWARQAQRDVLNLSAHPGLVTVPALTPMADGRPRAHGWWVDQPSYGEWEQHVRYMYEWARAHPERTTSPPTILTYAWNELDEGGPGIVPTWQNGMMFLDGIRAVKTGQYPERYVDTFNGDNCQVAYSGAWSRAFPRHGLFNNDEETTVDPGASALVTRANATGFELSAWRGPDRGQVNVLVDDVPQGIVDLYSPTPHRATVFAKTDLAQGTHSLRLVATGIKNPDSTGVTVGVDAVVVHTARPTGGGNPLHPNLALNRVYRASSEWDSNQAAGHAFDGRYDTDWQAAQNEAFGGSWLEVDFGTETTFNQVVLSEYGNRTTGFRIEYWSGGAWLTAYSGTTIGDHPPPFRFPPVTGTKARLYLTAGAHTPIVYEFEVHNLL